MGNTESEVLRAMGKGRVELKLGVPRSEEKSFDGIALGAGDGDDGESMMTECLKYELWSQ